ncbi:hypothetical protein LCGC14_2345570 [marine sediment metagenome]|uniref:Uncharacterized protein n=1 Tax=marine sediment metagenome TaxID=412755 RepID=A0A0F9CAM3_9ZZZZ
MTTEQKEIATDKDICIHCHHWIEEHGDNYKTGCDGPMGYKECNCPGFKGGGPKE